MWDWPISQDCKDWNDNHKALPAASRMKISLTVAHYYAGFYVTAHPCHSQTWKSSLKIHNHLISNKRDPSYPKDWLHQPFGLFSNLTFHSLLFQELPFLVTYPDHPHPNSTKPFTDVSSSSCSQLRGSPTKQLLLASNIPNIQFLLFFQSSVEK